MGYSDRPHTIRCPDKHKVVFSKMVDERPAVDADDDEQSQMSSDVEAIKDDVNDVQRTAVHDALIRHSPSSAATTHLNTW